MGLTKLIFLMAAIAISAGLCAQSADQEEENKEEFKHHRLALFSGTAHVPAGDPDVGRSVRDYTSAYLGSGL